MWASREHLADVRVGRWSSRQQLEEETDTLFKVKARLVLEAAELRRDRDRLGMLLMDARESSRPAEAESVR